MEPLEIKRKQSAINLARLEIAYMFYCSFLQGLVLRFYNCIIATQLGISFWRKGASGKSLFGLSQKAHKAK